MKIPDVPELPRLVDTRAPLRTTLRLARGGSRLVLFSTSTAWNMLRLVQAEAMGRDSPKHGADQTQKWCRQLLTWLGIDVRVRGQVPAAGALIVANHRSYMDIALIGAQLPCAFLAKRELLDWPLVGRSARLAGTVFVERGNRSSGVEAVRALREKLQRRLNVTVFPEGTTTRGPSVTPFQGGIFRQAALMEVPVVPVALAYDDPLDGWTNDDGTFVEHFLATFGKRRITAFVSFGPPIREKSASVLRRRAHAWIAAELERAGEAAAPRAAMSAEAPEDGDTAG